MLKERSNDLDKPTTNAVVPEFDIFLKDNLLFQGQIEEDECKQWRTADQLSSHWSDLRHSHTITNWHHNNVCEQLQSLFPPNTRHNYLGTTAAGVQRRHQQDFEENNFLLFQNFHEGQRNLLFWPQYEENISCGEIRVLKEQQDYSRVKLKPESSFVKLGSILVISESQESSSSVPSSSFSNAFLQLHFSNFVIAGFYSTFQDQRQNFNIYDKPTSIYVKCLKLNKLIIL